MKQFLLLSFFLCLTVFPQQFVVKPEITLEFKNRNLKGVFLLHKADSEEYWTNDPILAKREFTPASTFKIPNTLIGLEAGAIPDENYAFPWDSVKRTYDSWNKDLMLGEAFKASAVWYYQEVARKVGEKTMSDFLKKFQYGNKDMSGGVDRFWLNGALKISPFDQVEFLSKVAETSLPVSERSLKILRSVMVHRQNESGTVRAKTGWGVIDSVNYCWFVGYVEGEEGLWCFATLLIVPGEISSLSERIDITYKLLDTFGIFSGEETK